MKKKEVWVQIVTKNGGLFGRNEYRYKKGEILGKTEYYSSSMGVIREYLVRLESGEIETFSKSSVYQN